MRTCEADECNEQLARAKYCNKHRLRWLRHGDPNYRTKVAKGEYEGVLCASRGCDRQANVKGICTMNYSRDLRLKQKGIPISHRALDEE